MTSKLGSKWKCPCAVAHYPASRGEIFCVGEFCGRGALDFFPCAHYWPSELSVSTTAQEPHGLINRDACNY